MVILNCPQCRRNFVEETNCPFCGNKSNMKIVQSFEAEAKVSNDFEEAVNRLKEGNFKEALTLSDKVIEWTPRFSGIYWLRLFARHNVKSTSELLQCGFDPMEDPDFSNARQYADSEGLNAVNALTEQINDRRERLLKTISEQRILAVKNSRLEPCYAAFTNKLKEIQSVLRANYDDLLRTEQSMLEIEKTLGLVTAPYENIINAAAEQSGFIYTKMLHTDILLEEEAMRYCAELTTLQQNSATAVNYRDSVKNTNGKVDEYDRLQAQKNKLSSEIDAILSELKAARSDLADLLKQAEAQDAHYTSIEQSVLNYDFRKA